MSIETLLPPMPATELWDSWRVLRHWAIQAKLGMFFDDPSKRPHLKPAVLWEVEQGRALSRDRIERAAAIRSEWYRRADALFDRFDALVLPTAQVWPFVVAIVHPTQIAGRAMDTYHRWMEVVIPAGLIGLPAVAVPAGFGAQGLGGSGLPMGLQLIGRHGNDLGILQLAEAWHRATDWPGHRPPTFA